MTPDGTALGRARSHAAIVVVVAAVLLHLAMLLGSAHDGGLAATAAPDAPSAPAHVDESTASHASEHAQAPDAHLMLQLCLAVMTGGLLRTLRAGTAVSVTASAAPPGAHLPRGKLRRGVHGPGRSRIDTGLVLRV